MSESEGRKITFTSADGTVRVMHLDAEGRGSIILSRDDNHTAQTDEGEVDLRIEDWGDGWIRYYAVPR